MRQLACPHCGKGMALEAAVGETLTCPYCANRFEVGAEAAQPAEAPCPTEAPRPTEAPTTPHPAEAPPKTPSPADPDTPSVLALVKTAEAEQDVKRRYALLLEAEAAHPDSLAVQRALLFHGRLHERGGRTLDYSVIKCYLLHAFLEPETLKRGQRAAMIAELFDDPRVVRCMALSPDGEAFLREYLQALSRRYIAMFLRGSTKYMRVIFGFQSSAKAPRFLAEPAERILRDILSAPELSPERRLLLARAFYRAFEAEMSGDTSWLDARVTDCLTLLGA